MLPTNNNRPSKKTLRQKVWFVVGLISGLGLIQKALLVVVGLAIIGSVASLSTSQTPETSNAANNSVQSSSSSSEDINKKIMEEMTRQLSELQKQQDEINSSRQQAEDSQKSQQVLEEQKQSSLEAENKKLQEENAKLAEQKIAEQVSSAAPEQPSNTTVTAVAPSPAPAQRTTNTTQPTQNTQKAQAPTAAQPVTTQDPVYANCTEVRAAGKAPIYPGQPGFQNKFDRDEDGIGCE